MKYRAEKQSSVVIPFPMKRARLKIESFYSVEFLRWIRERSQAAETETTLKSNSSTR